MDPACSQLAQITITSQGRIWSANQLVYEIFGYPTGELVGKSAVTILPEFGSFEQSATGEIAIKGHNLSDCGVIETAGKHADGSRVPVELTLSRVSLGDQQIVNAIIRPAPQTKDVGAAINEFYSKFSHQLRTPLNSIRGSLSLIEGGRAGEMPERMTELVKMARSDTERLIKLINDIADSYKAKSSTVERKFEATAVPTQAADAAVKSSFMPQTSGSVYKILLVDDDENLYRILKMMLAGQGFEAIWASSISEAKTYLETKGHPDVLILDIGFPEGNGLDFLDNLRHKGKENIPVIVLSGREPDLATHGHPRLIGWIKKPFEEEQLISALHLAVRRRQPGPARVLIVEDHFPTREMIKQGLQSLNIEWLEAADGITAIHIAQSKDPDLIILDLGIPYLDGFQFVEILRNQESRLPALMVYTGRDLSEEDKLKLRLGLTAHLIKSRTSEEELFNTVKNLLSGLLSKIITRREKIVR